MNPIQIIYALASAVAFYVVFARMKSHEARLSRLENQRNEPEKRVQAPAQVVKQPAQYEKPVVPGAKPVKAVQIGDGKLNFDEQNQIAEWV